MAVCVLEGIAGEGGASRFRVSAPRHVGQIRNGCADSILPPQVSQNLVMPFMIGRAERRPILQPIKPPLPLQAGFAQDF